MEAWLPGEPLQEEWGACHVHLSPAGRTVRPPASPVTPEREAPRSHCGVQSQGRPSGSHRGWLCPPGDVRQCLETVLVVTPGGGTLGSQWVEARCYSAARSPGQACPQSELPGHNASGAMAQKLRSNPNPAASAEMSQPLNRHNSVSHT